MKSCQYRKTTKHTILKIATHSDARKDSFFFLQWLKWRKWIINIHAHKSAYCIASSAMHHQRHSLLFKIDYCVHLSQVMDCHEADPYSHHSANERGVTEGTDKHSFSVSTTLRCPWTEGSILYYLAFLFLQGDECFQSHRIVLLASCQKHNRFNGKDWWVETMCCSWSIETDTQESICAQRMITH